jgi:hypothetical protein
MMRDLRVKDLALAIAGIFLDLHNGYYTSIELAMILSQDCAFVKSFPFFIDTLLETM